MYVVATYVCLVHKCETAHTLFELYILYVHYIVT